MSADQPQSVTFRELLLEVRDGFSIFAPVLICIGIEGEDGRESTIEKTVTSQEPLDWAAQYTREYASHKYLLIGENNLRGGLDQAVTVGRSRRCHVKIDNESVSKIHASVVFDRNSGSYFVVDEHSRNGTCINGEQVIAGVRSSLWSGAYVSFGNAVYVFIDPPTLRKLSRLVV